MLDKLGIFNPCTARMYHFVGPSPLYGFVQLGENIL